MPVALPPERLYKFTERVHANALCGRGQFKVGTLYDYRRAEVYQGGVLDEAEGTAKLHEIVRASSYGDLSPFVRTMLRSDGPVEGGGVFGIGFLQETSVPDLYTYCTSAAPDWSCSSDERYDACVEIYDVKGFFRCITAILLSKSLLSQPGWGIGQVLYRGRSHQWDKLPCPIEFLKDDIYQNQREWRAAWPPAASRITPVIEAHSGIPPCVRMHALRAR